MSRLLSAIILGGSLVIGAFLMRPSHYEVFPAEMSEGLQQLYDARRYGVFDRRTGEVCYRQFARNTDGVMLELPRREGENARCATSASATRSSSQLDDLSR